MSKMSHTEVVRLLCFKVSFHMKDWRADPEDLPKDRWLFRKLQLRERLKELSISIDVLKKQKAVFAYCVLFTSCIMTLLLYRPCLCLSCVRHAGEYHGSKTRVKRPWLSPNTKIPLIVFFYSERSFPKC